MIVARTARRVLNRTPIKHMLLRILGRWRRTRAGVVLLSPRHVASCTFNYTLDVTARRRYCLLSEAEMRATRTSDTLFVFGAGKSLLDVSEDEWRRIEEHDTLSFSEFFRQSWIAPRYHMIGEIAQLRKFATQLTENPLFRDTILIVQRGWRAEDGNALLGRHLVAPGARVFRYTRTARGRYAPPSRSFVVGVVHGPNSVVSATNIAFLLGWRKIVLTGIDLYDKEYFWLPPGERRPTERLGVTASSTFTNAAEIVDMLGRWRPLFEAEGLRLEVYNPRSLLAGVLDVFAWPA
jgi:hypothetical protein